MQCSDITKAHTSKTLRRFGLLSLAVFGGWAAARAFTGDADLTTQVLGAAGGVLGVLGWLAPSALRPVFTAWMAAALPVGWVLSRVILAALYYVFFTPIAVAFRLIRRDALRRQRPVAASYWMVKPRPDDPVQYFKQF